MRKYEDKSNMFVVLIGIITLIVIIVFLCMDLFSGVKKDILINEPKVYLKQGESFTLEAKYAKDEKSNSKFIYKSNNTQVAEVDETTGKITAKSSGKATIRIILESDQTIYDFCEVIVSIPDGSKKVEDKEPVKDNKDTKKEEVKEPVKDNKDTKKEEVKEPVKDNKDTKKEEIIEPVENIEKYEFIFTCNETLTVNLGEKAKCELKSNPVESNIIWTSSNSNIANVDSNGNVAGLSVGYAVITAKSSDGKKTASYKVEVIEKVVVPTTINVTGIDAEKAIEMITGESKKIEYSVKPNNATNKAVTFTSSNKNVATVNNEGNITAIGSGYTTITTASKENGKILAKTDVIVDYSYFDTCSTSKVNTLQQLKTTSNNSADVYECLENQKFFNQGFAVTDKYIYFTNATYGTWCKVEGTYKLSKYNLSGDCIPGEYGPSLYVSGNRIIRYNKSNGKYIYNFIDLAGHGQAFDAVSGDALYINYFSKMIFSSTYGYGGGVTGFARVNYSSKDKDYIYPNLAMTFETNGNLTKYTPKNSFGTEEYLKEIYEKGSSSDIENWVELATDETSDSLAILHTKVTSNKNKTLYIYKLSDIKKGIMTLKAKYYIGYVCVDETKSNCAGQGIELKGNTLYTAQETGINGLHHESITKIDLTTCPTTDIKTTKCSAESINIPGNAYGKENGEIVGLSEIEGISIYKGKLYAAVISNAHSNGSRYNSVLLIDNF